MDLPDTQPLRDKMADQFEAGKQRAQAIHEGQTCLTLDEEAAIANNEAVTDTDGYILYNQYYLQIKGKAVKTAYAHDQAWAQRINEAPE